MNLFYDGLVGDNIPVSVEAVWDDGDKSVGWSAGCEILRVWLPSDISEANIMSLVGKLDMNILESIGYDIGYHDMQVHKAEQAEYYHDSR